MDEISKIANELRRYRDHDVETKIKQYLLLQGPRDLSSISGQLSLTDLEVLSEINPEGDSSLSQLVSTLALSQGAVSKVIAKLGRLSLLTKYHHADNKKESYVKLSASGKRIQQYHAAYHQMMDARTQHLAEKYTHDQLILIADFIERVNDLRES
ncbi:MAG: winged helix DNA-binding protein [Oenococcus sp.]|uniref:MarR family winged helix-turn-helix transcriptional regulator n=1 Tax=Oenococcus sp. TaxID=1979414 RepID=UPI0039E8C365